MNGAIIGLGHGERVISRAFRIEKIKLLGVYSKNLKKAHKYSKENNLKKIYQNIDDLINDKEIDLVAIAVPAYYQIGIIKKCLSQNKHIFAEKPITTNLIHLKKIIPQIRKTNKKFIIDYIYQKHEAFKKFKKILPKKIEKNTKININFKLESYVNKNKILNWKKNSNLGGGIINLYLPHILQYLIHFCGQISKCKIIKKNKTNLTINYTFLNGINSTINIDSNNSKTDHSISYENKKIKLELNNSSNDYAKNFKIIKFNKINNSKKIIIYDNKIDKFRLDGRIILTAKLLNLFYKKFNKREHEAVLKEYIYIEKILNKTRYNL